MMAMYFETVVKMSDIIFEGWDTNSAREVVFASFLAFMFTIFFEFLKIVKGVVILWRKQSPLSNCSQLENDITMGGSADSGQQSSQVDLLASLNFPTHISLIQRKMMLLFLLESLVHMFNFFYGYLLMLLVMTYSVWFLLAVVFGSGIGYFFFQPIGRYMTCKYSPSSRSGISTDEPVM